MIPTMPGRMYVVLGRFAGEDGIRFRAATMPDAPARFTREEAIDDERRWTKGDC